MIKYTLRRIGMALLTLLIIPPRFCCLCAGACHARESFSVRADSAEQIRRTRRKWG